MDPTTLPLISYLVPAFLAMGAGLGFLGIAVLLAGVAIPVTQAGGQNVVETGRRLRGGTRRLTWHRSDLRTNR